MFFRKKKERPVRPWDKENTEPAVRCSICNGEKVFGFKKIRSDEFLEIALVRTKEDLIEAAALYGISDVNSIPMIY